MRIPGMASVTDAARNIGGAWNFGWSMPESIADTFKGNPSGLAPRGTHLGSVGGLTTAFGAMGAGAAFGAVAATQMDGADVAKGAMIGAAVGAAAIPAAGLAMRGAWEIGSRAAVGLWNAGPSIASGVGKAAFGAAKAASPLASGALSTVLGVGRSLVRWDTAADALGATKSTSLLGKVTNTGGVKLTGMFSGAAQGFREGQGIISKVGGGVRGALINGQTAFWGGALFEGAVKGIQKAERMHMGQFDGQITKAAPRVPSYMDNAGASGDLVFALNANRRG